MAADSFHAAVEKAMRQNPPVTFPDFVDTVQKSKKNVDVLDMQANNFFQTTFNVSQYTLNQCKDRPYIDQIRKIIVRKGSMAFEYSSSVADDANMKSCSLFSKKQVKQVATRGFSLESSLKMQKNDVGLEGARKDRLLGVIMPIIKEEHKIFWEALPVKKN